MESASAAHRELFQLAQIADIIGFLEEARSAIVAALDHMLGNTGQIDSGQTRHIALPAKIERTMRMISRQRDQNFPHAILGSAPYPLFLRNSKDLNIANRIVRYGEVIK